MSADSLVSGLHLAGARLITAVALPPIIGLGFGFARAVGMIAVLPVFTRLNLGVTLRTAVALVVALISAPALGAAFRALPASPAPVLLVFMLLKEGALGVVLGVMMSVPFWATEMAGELIDQQRGSQGAIMQAGNQPEQAGMLGTLFILIFTVIFLASHGMDLVLRGYIASFEVWPAFAFLPRFNAAAGLGVLHLLDAITRAGVLLAAPLVIAMLVAELALGFLNRFAQQLNVFDLALSVKALIVAAGLCLYLLLLIGDFRRLLPDLLHIAPRLHALEGR